MHNVRINNVPKQCVQLLYTYNLNIEENEVGPDSRQVPRIDFSCLKCFVYFVFNKHNSTTGTRNAILAEPARTAVHDNVGIDVPTI